MTTALRTNHIQDEYERPVPGASIYVYNADNSLAALTSNGTTSIANPLTSDAFGNYSYYALVGYYREDVWFGGKLRWSENNVAVGSPGADLTLRANLQAWGLLTLTPQQDGAKGDGATNDNAAFVAALSALSSTALTGHGYGSGTAPLYIPKSTALYNMGSTPIDLFYTTRISGDGVGDAGGWATALKWSGSTGFRVQYYNTTGDTATGGGLPGGSASVIEKMALQGGYITTEGEFHGIFGRGRFAGRDLFITDFEGDGVHIHAASLSSESGNANNWELTKGFIQNTRNGVYITGSDANQGLLSQVSISAARQWGIYDEAGNTYISPLTQLCGFSGGDGTAGKPVSVVVKSGNLFAVKAGQEVAASTATPPASAIDDANWYYFGTGSPAPGQPTWFSGISLRAGGSYRIVNGGLIVGGYAEGGQPPAQLSGTTLVVGGQWPTLPKGGGYINANSNQIQINDLNVIAGGIQFADDKNGVLLVGRYSAGQPGYVEVSSAATNLTLRAPDNSDGVIIASATVSIPKPLAVTGAVTCTGATSSSGGVGYATGAGAAVTQLTNKSTATPAINKGCGQVTMNNAALAGGAKVSFVVTNSTVAATDTVIVSVASGGTANAYRAAVTAISAGVSFTVTVENITAGSLSEAPVINFAILKAVAA